MDRKTRAVFDARARVFKALAHPSRLFMVSELVDHERCVCELAEMVGADISTISKHLALLKSVGIVENEKRGLQVFYRLKTPCVVKFLECVETVLRISAQEAVACAVQRSQDQGR